ncbi:MAG: hypothetical protein HWN68_14125 [Desulfobacterales bacterium]|nr:hypothetical protein [Desulfobacterales bacterium]
MKKFRDITGDALSIGPNSQTENGDWLVRILGLSGAALPAIREEVRDMKREYELEQAYGSKRDISYDVSSRLIKRAAMKAGAVGSITSAPASLPVIGTLGTAIAGATADLACLLRVQTELCYAISAAYETSMDGEELKAITLALLGFSGSGEMVKEMAVCTLRSIVDATTERYLKKGIARAAAEVSGKIIPRLFARAYKLIPLISIPLSASINIASTMMVGNQARKYFSILDDRPLVSDNAPSRKKRKGKRSRVQGSEVQGSPKI